jgi:hypothetical protein
MSLANTDEEKSLIEYSFNKLIRNFDTNDRNNLINVIGSWAAALGVSKDITAIDIKMISTFISNQFGNLSLQEIEYAISLSLANKLNCDSNLYGKGLNVAYIGNILSAYIQYKRVNLADVNYKIQNQEVDKTPITPEYKMNICKETLVLCYRDWEANANNIGSLNSLYNDFKRIGLFKGVITQDDINKSIDYGKRAASDFIMKYNVIGSKPDKDQSLVAQQRFARNYIIAIYFKKNSLNSILEKLTVDKFS